MLLPIGVSATAEEALMKDSDFGSYKLEGNVPGERLGPIVPPPPKKIPCQGAFAEWVCV